MEKAICLYSLNFVSVWQFSYFSLLKTSVLRFHLGFVFRSFCESPWEAFPLQVCFVACLTAHVDFHFGYLTRWVILIFRMNIYNVSLPISPPLTWGERCVERCLARGWGVIHIVPFFSRSSWMSFGFCMFFWEGFVRFLLASPVGDIYHDVLSLSQILGAISFGCVFRAPVNSLHKTLPTSCGLSPMGPVSRRKSIVFLPEGTGIFLFTIP